MQPRPPCSDMRPSPRGGRRRQPFVATAVVLAAALAGCGAEQGSTPYRGVVVVVLDTVRADHTSLLGHAAPTSPALARLASRGHTYETCWTPSPWTAPAHASLFTGQLPDRHGLRRATSMFLADGADTLAGRLSQAGFATAGFSGSPMASPQTGVAQGFEQFELLAGDATMGQPVPAGSAGYSDGIARRALDWVRARRDEGRPHFAFVNLFDAHLPYDPGLESAERFVAGRPFELVEWARRMDHPFPMAYALGLEGLRPEQLDTLALLYDAEISTADAALHSLLDGLDQLGAARDTLVVVLADHGENLGDHGLLDHMLSVHASLLHVPLVIAAPGRLDDGGRTAELVRVEDVAPTVLDLCGLPPFAEADGVSVLDDIGPRVSHAWLDGMIESQVDRFRGAFGGVDLTPLEAPRRSVFDGRLHLVREEGLPDRLFDVVADPGELHDLAPERPGEVERLVAMITERAAVLASPPR